MVLRDLVSAKLVDFTGYRPLCQWSVHCVDDDTFVDADMQDMRVIQIALVA